MARSRPVWTRLKNYFVPLLSLSPTRSETFERFIKTNITRNLQPFALVSSSLVIGLQANAILRQPKKADSPFEICLQSFVDKHYAGMVIPDHLIRQLADLQGNSYQTPESNVLLEEKIDPEKFLHIEIKRSLSRLNCLDLLLQGDHAAHAKWIEAQTDYPISFEHFQALANLIRQQSDAAKEALRASCVISISDQAKSKAAEANAKVSKDSEKFLTDSIQQCPDIFPAVEGLRSEARRLMPLLYLRNSHLRHMLYLEGGENMFMYLKTSILNGTLEKQGLDIWKARWILNIAGFRGHLNPKGSIYCNDRTAETVLQLLHYIDETNRRFFYNPFRDYAEYRAKQMGVKSLYLAHIGASMRYYSMKEGKALQAWFQQFSEAEQKAIEARYLHRVKTLKTTPTYEVAVLDNLKSMACDLNETLGVYHLLSSQAETAYHQAIEAKQIDENTPLCFATLAFKANLEIALEAYRQKKSLAPFSINPEGHALLDLVSLKSSLDQAEPRQSPKP